MPLAKYVQSEEEEQMQREQFERLERAKQRLDSHFVILHCSECQAGHRVLLDVSLMNIMLLIYFPLLLRTGFLELTDGVFL